MEIATFPKNIENKLGFDKIRQLVAEQCTSELGKKNLKFLDVTTDPETIQIRIEQTFAFLQILETSRNFPLDFYHDLKEELHLLSIPNAVLQPEEHLRIYQFITTVKAIIRFFKNNDFPILAQLIEDISYEESLRTAIYKVIDEKAEIRENVSAQLRAIRNQIRKKERELEKRFQVVLKKAQSNRWLSEEGESMRSGRRVIAILAEHKRKVQGAIVDESSTGKTFFVEPQETIDIHNQLFELRHEEKKEIIKILRKLTADIRPCRDTLLIQQDVVGQLDFIRAKALFGQQIMASKPVISKRPGLKLLNAYHPLLLLHHRQNSMETVPLSMVLDEKKRILVISGPNAGGKSVCLKTVGLLQMMFQAGLLIPAEPDSEMGIFNNIFADIGDDQSIENDLSTYSSHLRNLKYFTEHSDDLTLFLIDEFGTGTDPELGGPIAEAILDYLNLQKSYGVITTHYSNLKIYASQTEGIDNGAMVFNKANLSPEYILITGKPGSSYSFEVAEKIGIQEKILREAKNKIHKDIIELDQLLAELEESKRKVQNQEKELAQKQKKLDSLQATYQARLNELEKKKKQIILESRQKALHHVDLLNKKFQNLVREWKEQEKNVKEQARKGIHEEIIRQKNALTKDVDKLIEKLEQQEEPESIEVGDLVRLKEGTQEGRVEKIKKGRALVEFENVKTEIKLTTLTKVREKQKHDTKKKSNIQWEMHSKNFLHTIDVRGKRVEEALKIIEKWIDDAILLNQHNIKVVHGTGEGKLRPAIRKYLKNNPGIKSFSSEVPQFGGEGVTVITLN